MPAILVALIFRTLDALRVFDLPYVLTGARTAPSTCPTIAQEAFAANRIYGPRVGDGGAHVHRRCMIVSFSYIRFVGGNLRGLGDD
jgi:multiple sugar transport system permease protein